MERKRKLGFRAILQPEDYGPVIRCLVIRVNREEDFEWLENYRFPGPVHAAFRSDKDGRADALGEYYTVFPVQGPDISWTQAFEYDVDRERNTYRTFDFPGLKCVGVFCPACDAFIRRRKYKLDGADIEYTDYLPPAYLDRKGVRTYRKGTLPLIIWLHGLGEGGDDISVTLLGNRVTSLTEATTQYYFPGVGAAVLVPKCPTMWMDTDGAGRWDMDVIRERGGSSYYTKPLKQLIVKYLKSHPEIDRSRIYIGGCSNGGFMTLQMLLAMPGKFAAAFPICPAYCREWMTEDRIKKLAKVPMWITAAATDRTLPLRRPDGSPDYADALYEKLMALPEQERAGVVYSRLPQVMGYTATGFPYEYNGHWSWIPVLQDRVTREFDGEEIHLFEWMAEKKSIK